MAEFDDPTALGEALKKAFNDKFGKVDVAKDFLEWINQTSKYPVNSRKLNKSTVEISFKGLSSMGKRQDIKFLDLKPFFRQSSKVKYPVGANTKAKRKVMWYLIVPIANKAKDIKNASKPRSLYEQLVQSDFGTTIDLGSDRLQDRLGQPQANVIDPLQYSWKSGNVTRVQKGRSKKLGSYISFRTVSDKSSPNSWILGRQAADITNPDFTPEMQDDIKRAMAYKVKLYKSHMSRLYGG